MNIQIEFNIQFLNVIDTFTQIRVVLNFNILQNS